MGFSWNGIHTLDVGIFAEARTLPVIPEPKIVTEEIAGRDGFYDFSAFNPAGRVHYAPREWEYRCSFDSAMVKDPNARVRAVMKLLTAYSGYLIDDKCGNVRWAGAITNKINLAQTARTLHSFSVYIRTQAFAEGLEKVVLTGSVSGSGSIAAFNPGTWYVSPEYYLTGTADGAALGGFGLPDGVLNNYLADGAELAPGENEIAVSGFSGTVRVEFTPLYVWGW